MKLFFKKLLNILLYISLFLGYFYVLFVNLMFPPTIHTQADAIRHLILVITLSVGIPSIICMLIWHIRSMEK